MDLFVVNRYKGDENPSQQDEKAKLDKVLLKIKKRKIARQKNRQKQNLKVKKVSRFKIAKLIEKGIKPYNKVLIQANVVEQKKELPPEKNENEAETTEKPKYKHNVTDVHKVFLMQKKLRKLKQQDASKYPEKQAIQIAKLEKRILEKKQDENIAKQDQKIVVVEQKLLKLKQKLPLKKKNEAKATKKKPIIEEINVEELTPEEIAEKLLKLKQKLPSKKGKNKAKTTKKKSIIEELNVEELTVEEIAEKILQKQIEALKQKTIETIDDTNVKETNDEVVKKRKKAAETVEKSDSDSETCSKKLKHAEDVEGFQILGQDKFEKKQIVKRVLPKWLRLPTVISSDLNNLQSKISDISINPKLKECLQKKGIVDLFPVQAEFIPWQLKNSLTSGLIPPQDACISAPTGSGKTLAFTIPVLESLLNQIDRKNLTVHAIRALIILPTQNLALQIYETLKSLSFDNSLTVGLATGAGNRTLEQEQRQLIQRNSVWGTSSKVDVLVCTAGRLVDHLKSTKGFDLRHLQYLIIDEADRVLDSIQTDWLYHLGLHLSLNRNIVNVKTLKRRQDPQKLLFSATLSQDPEKLQKLTLFQPKLFSSGSKDQSTKYTIPAELTEKYILCTIDIKPLLLYKIIVDEIDKNPKSKILIFVNTLATLHRLNVLLKYMGQEKFTVGEFSTNKTNLEARKSLLENFQNNLIQVLVCTDSMARGIDIPYVDCVIMYSVPNHLKTYVHRAGRTARAGSRGLCISMLHQKQLTSFLMLIDSMTATSKLEEIKFPPEHLELLTPLYEKCLTQLKDEVSGENERSALKLKTRKLAFNKKNKKMRKKFHKTRQT